MSYLKKILDLPPWKHYMLVAGMVWTLSILASYFWDVHWEKHADLVAAKLQARSLFSKDISYRRWNAQSGGVYVPLTPKTQPNPYLRGVSEREILTPSGRVLTLMNPSYMTRQVHEIEKQGNGVNSHLTSFTPLNPGNVPDAWEADALNSFEQGAAEISSIEEIQGKPFLRLMRPLVMEENCLKCHAKQGLGKGDVYGGISVSVPFAPFQEMGHNRLKPVAAGHFILWLAGTSGLCFGAHRFRRSESERLSAEESMKRSLELSSIVLESTQDAICVIDATEYTILSVNQRFLRQMGLTEEQVLGNFCHTIMHRLCEPCEQQDFSCPLQTALLTGDHYTVEHLHIGTHGEKNYQEVTTYPIFDEKGDIRRILHLSRDITTRKLTEDTLRESQEKYRAIFENTGTATIIVEEDTTISMANKEFEQLSGYMRNAVEHKKSWKDFVQGEDLDKLPDYDDMPGLDANVVPETYQFRFLGAGNSVRDVVARWVRIPGTTKSVGSFLDITEQTRIEKALRSSEGLLAIAQRISHLGSWDWDIESNVFQWSDEMYRIWGVNQKDFQVSYEAFFCMVHPEDKEELNRAINEAIYAHKLFKMDFRIILPDGKLRTLAGQGEVVFSETGAPIRMVGTTQDVTWRKEAEDALRKSEEKFSKAFHASPDWIVITRAADGKYIEVNEAFLEITGYTRKDVIGKTSIEMGIWLDPKDRMRMLKLLNQHGLVRNLEVLFRNKSGALRIMLWSAEVIEYADEACLIAVARDVTEQRHLEKELLKSQSQLFMKHEELKNLFVQMESIRREWEETLDFIADMFILVDSEGRIKRFNRAVEDFTAVSHRDIVGRKWQEFLTDYGLWPNVEKPGVELYNESTEKWLVLNFYPYTGSASSGDVGGVVTIHDVTTIKMKSIEQQNLGV